jgi:molybdopterin converting factor small subunit
LHTSQAREFAGTKEDEFVLSGPADVDNLFSEVVNAHPKLQEIREIIRTLVNGRVVLENVELKNGDRLALLPPVAGG